MKARYTVYDNKTNYPIAVNLTAEECAKKMGICFSSFYNCVDRCGKGTNNRWTIRRIDLRDMFLYEDVKDIVRRTIRLTELANFLKTSDYVVEKICKEFGVEIFRVGEQKIRMVSTKQFCEKLKQRESAL